MNSWNGTGRLTRDPELSYSQSGVAICRFTLAINRKFKRDETDFIPIVTFNKTAESCGQYLTKGSLCGIEGGRIQTRSYEGQDGKKKYATEVIAETVEFLSPKSSSQSSPAPKDEWNEVGVEVAMDDDSGVPF